jgi:hypothetical protein
MASEKFTVIKEPDPMLKLRSLDHTPSISDATIGTSPAGFISSTVTSPRQNQFALKLIY